MFYEIRTRYFPHAIVDGIVVRPITTRSAFFGITGKLFDKVFTPFSTLGAYTLPVERHNKMKPLSRAFAQTHQEHFIFYDEQEQVVGWSYGEMHDTETFFMSNSAILPQYRRRGIYRAFLRYFIEYLETLGYERVTSNHQPNNTPVLIAKLQAGFVLSGVILDERWSAQIQMTYHMHLDRRQGFVTAFSLEKRGIRLDAQTLLYLLT